MTIDLPSIPMSLEKALGTRTLVITLEVVHLVVLIVAALVLKEYLFLGRTLQLYFKM